MKQNRACSAFCFFLCVFLLELQLFRCQPPLASKAAPLAEALAEKVLRLHIIAEDDSARAQEIKLQVRDHLLSSLSPFPETVTTKAEAVAYLEQRLPKLQALVDEFLAAQGCSFSSAVSLEKRYFPIKDYGEYRFPAGAYDALCITLGSGEGQNWWCLAFPRFCFLPEGSLISPDGEADELKILLTDEEYEAILKQEPEIQLESRLLRWLRSIFSGKYIRTGNDP